MGDYAKHVVERLRDIAATYGAKAVVGGSLAVATVCAGAVGTLFRCNGQATVRACVSMVLYGFAAGWLAKWVHEEKAPLHRARRMMDAMPRNLLAVLYAAYERKGTFRRTGWLAEQSAGDDLSALESWGMVERAGNGAWVLSSPVRAVLDRSEGARTRAEEAHAEWVAEMREASHSRQVEAVRGRIAALDCYGRSQLADLLRIDGPVSMGEHTAYDLLERLGDSLLKVRDRFGGCTVEPTALAREVAPPMLADELTSE